MQQIDNKEKEISDLDIQIQELLRKKKLIESDVFEDYIKHMNDSPEMKLKMFIKNSKIKYDEITSEQNFIRSTSSCIDFGSFLGSGNSLFGEYATSFDLLTSLFKELFNIPKFKVVSNTIYKFNEETGEIFGYTQNEWMLKRRKSDFALLKSSIELAANGKVEPKEKEYNVIKDYRCGDYRFSMSMSNLESMLKYLDVYKEVHINYAYFKPDSTQKFKENPSMELIINGGFIYDDKKTK